jgi:hypothetical protein
MSFLLRSLFWLGLVFSQIAEREGASLASLAQPARQELAARAEQVKARAVEAAAASCGKEPSACLALAAQAARSQIGPDHAAPAQAAPAPIARPALDRAGHDTLRDADRAPGWRLHRANDGA